MPQQPSSNDQTMSNRAANKEQAERSQKNTNAADSGGITNRPMAEEEHNQGHMPPRGEAKDGTHA